MLASSRPSSYHESPIIYAKHFLMPRRSSSSERNPCLRLSNKMKYLWVNIKGFGFCCSTNAYARAYHIFVYAYVYRHVGIYHAACNTLTWLDPGLVAGV